MRSKLNSRLCLRQPTPLFPNEKVWLKRVVIFRLPCIPCLLSSCRLPCLDPSTAYPTSRSVSVNSTNVKPNRMFSPWALS